MSASWRRCPPIHCFPVTFPPHFEPFLSRFFAQILLLILAQVSGALDTGDVWLLKNQKQMRVDNAVSDLKEACEKIGEVAATVNEAIREVRNAVCFVYTCRRLTDLSNDCRWKSGKSCTKSRSHCVLR